MVQTNRQQVLALAIETSGRLGSVAISRGPLVLEAAVLSAEQRHAVELLPAIQSLCKRHEIHPREINEVYVSAGPGSFTGLRVGMTVARTLAWSIEAKVVRVPTLDAVAQNALDLEKPPQHLAVLLDAKRKHAFATAYRLDQGKYKPITEPKEVDIEAFAASLPAGAVLMGEGIPYHAEAVARTNLQVLPEDLNRARAEAVHRLGYAAAQEGLFDPLADLTPIYIRRPEAEEVWEKRHGPDGETPT